MTTLLGHFVGLIGLALGAAAFVCWRVYVRQSRYSVTEGVVARIDPDSSGEFATVHYAPNGQFLVGGQPFALRASVGTGVYEFGAPATVRYDPANPTRATLTAPAHMASMALILGAVGLLMVPLWAMVALWLGPLEEGRDQALGAFIAAAKARDSARIRSLSAPGAQVTQDFIDEAARSQTYRLGSNNIGFSNDACVELYFDSERRPYYVYMDKPKDWRIVRANHNDPVCIDDLDD